MDKPEYVYSKQEDPHFGERERIALPDGSFIEQAVIPYVQLPNGSYAHWKKSDAPFIRIHGSHSGVSNAIIYFPTSHQDKFDEVFSRANCEDINCSISLRPESSPIVHAGHPLSMLETDLLFHRGGCVKHMVKLTLPVIFISSVVYIAGEILEVPRGYSLAFNMAMASIYSIFFFLQRNPADLLGNPEKFKLLGDGLEQLEKRRDVSKQSVQEIIVTPNAPDLEERIRTRNDCISTQEYYQGQLDKAIVALPQLVTLPPKHLAGTMIQLSGSYDDVNQRILSLIGYAHSNPVDVSVALGTQTRDDFQRHLHNLTCMYDHAPLSEDSPLPIVGMIDETGKLTGAFAHEECAQSDSKLKSRKVADTFDEFEQRMLAAFSDLGDDRSPQALHGAFEQQVSGSQSSPDESSDDRSSERKRSGRKKRDR